MSLSRISALIRRVLAAIAHALANTEPRPCHPARIHYYENEPRSTASRRGSDREEAPSARKHDR